MNKIEQYPAHWRDYFLRQAADQSENVSQQWPLRQVLLSLRDMPYARPSGGNTAKACISEGTGTCSAKHLAAYEWLTLTGHRPQLWMASYLMDFRQPYYSDALRSSASDLQVYDVHNFLTCDVGHGDIVIDITFPVSLGDYGFPVTAHWDGKSDFKLCCAPQARIALDDPDSADKHKRAWLEALNSEQALRLREAGIQEMMAYIHRDQRS